MPPSPPPHSLSLFLMFYQPKSEEQVRQKARLEAPSKEETDLRDRIRGSWPGDIVSDGAAAAKVSGSVLRRVLQEHDKPHPEVRDESWHVHGALGRDRRFAFASTFSLTAVSSSVNPPDESASVNNLAAVQWSITDNSGKASRYYRFSCLDHRAAVLISALLAKGELGSVEQHIVQATVEQLNGDKLILPDQMMDRQASARFGQLELRFGDSFLKKLTPDKFPEKADMLEVIQYHLHLEGTTNEDPSGDLSKEFRAELDVVFKPHRVPVLDGDRGVMGHGDWKSDLFCYSLPHTRVVEASLRITRASDDLEVARMLDIHDGSAWMDHRFGGVVPRSAAEGSYLRSQRAVSTKPREDVAIDRFMLRLYNEDQDCISVTRVATVEFSAGAEPRERREDQHVYVMVQSAKSRAGYGYVSTPATRAIAGAAKAAGKPHTPDMDISVAPVVTKQYRSRETTMLYPMEFTITVPMYNGAVANLTVAMTFYEQELASSLLQPSAWVGTVSVKGTIAKPAAEGVPAGGDRPTTSAVTGEGMLQCFGRGVEQSADALLDAFRAAAIAPLESAPTLAAVGGETQRGWEKVAESPVALAALGSLAVVASMPKLALTDAHKVVLAAMLGAYGYIYHHHANREAVEDALQWCHGKWITYFGLEPIDTPTLIVRAFMLRELGALMHTKCAGWVPCEAVALDILAVAAAAASTDAERAEALAGKRVPTATELARTPTDLEMAQLKALMDGRWRYAEADGSLSAVLVEQHVPVLWRNLLGKVHPTLDCVVNRDKRLVEYDITTIIEEMERQVRLDGQEWTWNCPARGPLLSRACVMAEGRQLYIDAAVRQGVERVWFSFLDKGKTMVETTTFTRTRDGGESPSAWCARTFSMVPSNQPAKKSR